MAEIDNPIWCCLNDRRTLPEALPGVKATGREAETWRLVTSQCMSEVTAPCLDNFVLRVDSDFESYADSWKRVGGQWLEVLEVEEAAEVRVRNSTLR